MFSKSDKNKKEFVENIQKIIKESDEDVWENLFEGIYKQLFELFKEDDWEIKDGALDCLINLFTKRPQDVENYIDDIFEELAILFSTNKKVILATEVNVQMGGSFDQILNTINMVKNKGQMFHELNLKISNQQNQNL